MKEKNNMKKLIIATVLVVVLAIGAFGSNVMADKPENAPTPAPWDKILQKIGDVGAKAEQIYQKVLDNAANTTKIHSGSGNYTVPAAGGVFNALEIDGDSVAQVTLTVAQNGFGTGDNAFVRLDLPNIAPAITIIDGWGPVTTVVFAAEDWKLNVEGDGGERISYAYTIIYH
jgi:hypothetical protein